MDQPETMKAIVRDRYGSVDVLELREIERPLVGDDDVVVRVRAAGVDQGVWHVMAGLPYPIRVAGFGLRAPKNPVLGADVAGVVQAVGKEVTRVSAWRRGVRYRQGLLRRVRLRVRGQTGAQAGQPHVRAGGGCRHLRLDRPAGPTRPRQGAPGPEGADRWCVRWRGDVRRAGGQGVRGSRGRRVQHDEGGLGSLPWCRPCHRLHA